MILTTLLLGCIKTSAETPAAEIDGRPNIIFIFADDLGWGDIGVNGHPDIKTPNIDRLAKEGTGFELFTVSNPVCSPSRAAVMTGQYPARNSVHRHFAGPRHARNFSMPDWLDTSVVTMPRVLQSAGYKTGHFGKWHLTTGHKNGAPVPTEYGYDESAVFNGPGPQTNYFKLYDDADDFIRRNKDEPFFVNLWLHETHLPHHPPETSMAKYAHLDKQQQVYAAVVDGADERIGGILDTLDELGLAENTLVVFTSDNGPAHTGPKSKSFHRNTKLLDGMAPGILSDEARRGYGLHYSVGQTGGLRGGKADTYEGGLRVPFLVRWPGKIPAGRLDSEDIVTAVDLLPTFAEAAGAELPEGYHSDGQSVLSAFEGGSVTRDKPIFWHWSYGKKDGTAPMLAVRDGVWKLFIHQENNTTELYNLETDRAENHNVADQNPDIVARLKPLALAWQETLPNDPPASAIAKSGNKKKNRKKKQ